MSVHPKLVVWLALIVACERATSTPEKSGTAAAAAAVTRTAAARAGVTLDEIHMAPPPTSARYALLVAIDSYPDPAHRLPSPGQDAADVREMLASRFAFPQANIVVLRNSAATRDAILDAFRTHLSKAGADGVALFYFVGHGLQLDKDYSVAEAEATNRDQALYVWGANGKGAIVLDDELNVLFRDLGAGRRVAIIDACYSGSSLKGFRGWIKWLALQFAGDTEAADRKETPFVMSVPYSSPGKPAAFPPRFISDGQTLSVIDSLPLVFLAAADESEPALSVVNFPQYPQSRSVFSYYLDTTLRAARSSDPFTSVLDVVARGIRSRRACIDNRHECQTPQIQGGLRFASLQSVLGAP